MTLMEGAKANQAYDTLMPQIERSLQNAEMLFLRHFNQKGHAKKTRRATIDRITRVRA